MSTIATGQGHELRFAPINVSASGDTTLAANVAGRKIKVVSYTLVASGAVAVKFKSGASTDLTGAMSFASNGGISVPGQASSHLFECAVATDLVINLSAAVAVAGHVAYFLEQ